MVAENILKIVHELISNVQQKQRGVTIRGDCRIVDVRPAKPISMNKEGKHKEEENNKEKCNSKIIMFHVVSLENK